MADRSCLLGGRRGWTRCAPLCRVYVQGNKKRGPIPLKGKEAVVVRVLGKGTVFLEAPGSVDPVTRLQQKCAAVLFLAPLCLRHQHSSVHSAVTAVRQRMLCAGSRRCCGRDGTRRRPPWPRRPRLQRRLHQEATIQPRRVRSVRARLHCMREAVASCACVSRHGGCGAATEPSSTLPSPGKEVASGPPQTDREMLQLVRSQMMDDEAEVPWDAVHSFWRSRRSRWRQVRYVTAAIVPMLTPLTVKWSFPCCWAGSAPHVTCCIQ